MNGRSNGRDMVCSNEIQGSILYGDLSYSVIEFLAS